MYIITVASFKGGSGKTTLAAGAAIEFERLGYGPVALIDTDWLGGLGEWWNARQAETPRFTWASARQLRDYLDFLPGNGIHITLIDTPPATASVIRDAIAVCDLVLVPVRPSPNDLRAIDATVEIIEQAGKDFLFVLNAASPRSHIVWNTLQTLSERGHVAPVILHNRVDFAVSMTDGRTVSERRRTSKSAREMQRLTQYIHTELLSRKGLTSADTPEHAPSPSLRVVR